MLGDLSQSPDAVRRALITHVSTKLRSLLPESADVPGWLAGVPTARIIQALRLDPELTAEALADALAEAEPRSAVAGQVAVATSVVFPAMPEAERARIVAFALAVRTLEQEAGGEVTAERLAAAGFAPGKLAGLMDQVAQVTRFLASLEASDVPGLRLALYGQRAADQKAAA